MAGIVDATNVSVKMPEAAATACKLCDGKTYVPFTSSDKIKLIHHVRTAHVAADGSILYDLLTSKKMVEEWMEGGVKKYLDAHEHMNAIGSPYYCERSSAKGSDGTQKHWGKMYHADPSLYYCDNHKAAATDGKVIGSVRSYGGGEKRVCGYCGTGEAKWVATKGTNKPRNLCDGCREVHIASGGWIIRALHPTAKATTQKARGVEALWEQGFPTPIFELFRADKITAEEKARCVGKFVRPCPVRPRHGFVESRQVAETKQLETLILETLAADPDAELLAMPYVDAPFSGIWTTGQLALGKGTDGATGGKSAVTLPVLGDFTEVFGNGKTLKKAAGVKSAPYLELLWKKLTPSELRRDAYQWQAVQLRDGPMLPATLDYIPRAVEVKHVLTAGGDLLEWEKKIKEAESGTAVYHPGGSLASHYAVHAVLSNIPVLITREPVVGETLEPSGEENNETNVDAMRAGFVLAVRMAIQFKEAVMLLLAGCHNTVAWKGRHDLLLGVAMGLGWRLAYCEAVAERRHIKAPGTSREAVYVKKWDGTYTPATKAEYVACLNDFLFNVSWPGHGIGGPQWYYFTVEAVKAHNALVVGDAKKALEALNKLANGVHNGGWGFNKFCGSEEMNRTAANPCYAAVFVGPYLYETLTGKAEVDALAAIFVKEAQVVETLEEKLKEYKRPKLDIENICEWCGKKGHEQAQCASWLATQTPKKLDVTAKADELSEAMNALGKLPPFDATWASVTPKKTPLSPNIKSNVVTHAQCCFRWTDQPGCPVHVQFKTANYSKYGKRDLACPDKVAYQATWNATTKCESLAGKGTTYALLKKGEDGWYLGKFKLLNLEEE